jgi:hypothetical protein
LASSESGPTIEAHQRGQFTDRWFIRDSRCKPPFATMNETVPLNLCKESAPVSRTQSETSGDSVCEWSRRQLGVKAGNNVREVAGEPRWETLTVFITSDNICHMKSQPPNTRHCFLRRCNSIARTRVIATTTTLLERGSGLYSLAGTPVPVLPYFERG